MKRNVIWVAVSVLVVLGLLMGGFGCAAPAPEKIELSFACQYAPTSSLGVDLMQPAIDEIYKRSNGRLEIKPYWAESLFKGTELFDALSTGKLDMAFVTTYHSSVVPEVLLPMVPFLISDANHIKRAWDAGIGKIWGDAMLEHNIRYELGDAPTSGGRNVLWCNKVMPKLPSDIDGLKIRSYNALLDALVVACGGAPVSMAGGEIYLAVQRGTVDGYITGIAYAGTQKLYEVTKYVSLLPLANAWMGFAMNEDVWQSLPKDLQKIVHDVYNEVGWDYNLVKLQAEEDAVLAQCEAAGVEVHEPTPEELEAWRGVSGAARDKFIELAGDNGRKMLEIADSTR